MFMNLFTKKDVNVIASAVAEANGTTLKATIDKINANAVSLENEAKTALKTAATTEATANTAYQNAINEARKTLDIAGREIDQLRSEAQVKMTKAAGKLKAVKLLS